MKRVNVILRAISILWLSLSFCFAGQISDSNIGALKGVKAVFVLVADLPQRAIEMGLTAEGIKTATESKLKVNGLL